ncbi:5'-AMP-activated protein kinase beta subunit, interation domain-containing protein [Pyronema domesticum]|uniref:Similar to Uncharacterized protein C1919.03c acc. no. P78789 n=1 Tax=Pyronema omphalodes (strain CBS 100304) TaxID=1076935 RepID=U4LAT6_PYROM|nr:5'-AMP-activated protein kinase beta subunit, interation domain-containing protein [Pyronema domesticum]CCX07274.1 Similar to Uncharacterized protein C1919.03c; acc. no. P78789 [Pyronema omphalodes CBS 100304]
MGNNPSRAAPAQNQQQSNSTTASTSPTNNNLPTRTPSASRRQSYRRNSLQAPGSSAQYGPGEYALRPRNLQHIDGSNTDYLLPTDPQSRYAGPLRRESIAAPIPEGDYEGFPICTREELLADAATLRLFPTPPPNDKVAAIPPAISEGPGLFTGNPFGQSVASRASTTPGDGMRQRNSLESMMNASIEEDVPPESDGRAIPTLIQWPHEGTKVFVTGTFCSWDKKYRLTRNAEDGILSAMIDLPPGTHHVKFLVDGEMMTSDNLSTAVDSSGILVNYIEVSADEMPPLGRQYSTDSATRTEPQSTNDFPTPGLTEGQLHYTNEIPAYLKEYENYYDEDRHHGHRSGSPPPPTLPMMLQKVILNSNLLNLKDDASVLSIPNHAVLNHLATSSIKNGILAVSATTRYRKKYVTTILYKAATADE